MQRVVRLGACRPQSITACINQKAMKCKIPNSHLQTAVQPNSHLQITIQLKGYVQRAIAPNSHLEIAIQPNSHLQTAVHPHDGTVGTTRTA